MVPPDGMAVVGVKSREMGTEDLPTTRSEETILKATDMTRNPIPPDETAFENEHSLSCNFTLTEPVVGGPIVKPPMVTVTADHAMMAAPKVVITTEVADVALHVALKPGTLLAFNATDGMMLDAKKFKG